MWVFGYGSLMWDGWEKEYGCDGGELATLDGFRRDFNKASVRNWGSKGNPGPTLGLIPDARARCVGLAFDLPDTERHRALRAIKSREGSAFVLEERAVELESGSRVTALVSVNDMSARAYIGDLSIEDRIQMAATATGSSGMCMDYVRNVGEKLHSLGIEDAAVRDLVHALSNQ